MGVLDNAVVSSTYGGETLSLAAAKAAIETYRKENVIDHLWRQGEKMWLAANDLARHHGLPIELTGMWPCPMFRFEDDALHEPFFRAAYRNGLSLYNVVYVNFSHKDADAAETLQRLDATMKEVAAA